MSPVGCVSILSSTSLSMVCAVVHLLRTEYVLGWILPGSVGATLQSFWIFGCYGPGTFTQLLVKRTAAVTEGCVCVSTRNLNCGWWTSPFSCFRVCRGRVWEKELLMLQTLNPDVDIPLLSTAGEWEIHFMRLHTCTWLCKNSLLPLGTTQPHTAWATMGLIMDHYHGSHQERLATASGPKDRAETIHPQCRWAFWASRSNFQLEGHLAFSVSAYWRRCIGNPPSRWR